MKTKHHSEIGACGIVCSLCPRFHTNGPSRCTGCGAEGFRDVHPACKIHTCACVKQGLESCADCKAFPCEMIKPWDSGDSFVTHRTCLNNLRRIQSEEYGPLLAEIKRRTDVLNGLLERHDDGRSKRLFCLACALLPVEDLEEIGAQADALCLDSLTIRQRLQEIAEERSIELTLRTERNPA
jgi:hypothetical protein